MRRWKNRPEGSNWGEFGDDDERGRMNTITPEVRRAALAEAREGIVFVVCLPMDYPGGSVIFPTRKPPVLRADRRGSMFNYNYEHRERTGRMYNVDVTCDDSVLLYTQYSTQWDALGHYGQLFDADGDGKPERVYYNGFRADEHLVAPRSEGDPPQAKALGIEKLAETGAQGRGTLVDLHAIYGRERVSVGYDALMRALDRQKAEVKKGDFLCLYTGLADMILEMNKQPDVDRVHKSCAGLDGGDPKLLDWIDKSGIVAICADNTAVEGKPTRQPGELSISGMPLHAHCIFKLGIHLGELWYFRELAQWLAAHQRSSFLLTAPPLRLPGSVGSPVMGVATV